MVEFATITSICMHVSSACRVCVAVCVCAREVSEEVEGGLVVLSLLIDINIQQSGREERDEVKSIEVVL